MLPLITFSCETIIAADVTGEITVTRIIIVHCQMEKAEKKATFCARQLL